MADRLRRAPKKEKGGLFAFDWENTILGTIPQDLHSVLYFYHCPERPALKDKYEFKFAFGSLDGKPSHEPGKLSGPFGLAFHPDSGELYCSDNLSNRIQAFKPDGTFIRVLDTDKEHEAPSGMVFDRDRHLVVTEFSGDEVRILDIVNGQTKVSFKANSPYGVAIDRDGNIAVAEWANRKQVGIWTPTGTLLRSFDHPVRFRHPIGIAFWDEKLFVSDYDSKDMISGFDADGKLIENFRCEGLEKPCGIAIDQSGCIVVAGFDSNEVRVLSNNEARTTLFTLPSNPQYPLDQPVTPLLDNEGNLYITNFRKHQIFVYG